MVLLIEYFVKTNIFEGFKKKLI